MQLKIIILILAFTSSYTFAQSNFSFVPQKPKAGESITITYTPSGTLANVSSPIVATVSVLNSKGLNANDLDLAKSGNSFSGVVKTTAADNFVFFSFSADKVFDNNFNDGYWIQLYDGDKIKSGSGASLSLYYQFYGRGAGVDPNNEKALSALEEQFKLYPDSKKENLVSYVRLYTQIKKDEAPATIQKEIEAMLKNGLKEEDDYSRLQILYSIAKLPQQSSLIGNIIKEKFPAGKTVKGELVQKFLNEKDLLQKQLMLDELLNKINTDPEWKYLEPSRSYFISTIPSAYVAAKDWMGMKRAIEKYHLQGQDLASLDNNTAWEMQGNNDSMQLAEQMSSFAVNWAKNEWHTPTGEKPSYLPKSQWEKSLAEQYGMYADTYGMIMFKLGNYKKGFPYSEDAAIKINKGQDADENNTYALLAEKSVPEKKYVPVLEKFVKDGKATSGITDILKRSYIRHHKTEKGFDDYIGELTKENYLKMLEDLRKGVLNDVTPQFALLDLSGKKVNISDLKNKIVVVDFWATWCGPCKASFPGMQKMIAKYKNDPEVEFLFVDTWERETAKEKNAQGFISSKKYDFHVLMDNENKVIESFNVNGIPTKFVIDKAGKIRFKAAGFDGSDDKLVSELSAMIDMAKKM